VVATILDEVEARIASTTDHLGAVTWANMRSRLDELTNLIDAAAPLGGPLPAGRLGGGSGQRDRLQGLR
jgi:hypothetical protein